MRQFDIDSGEEMFAIMLKAAYGMPQAGRRWSEHRNKFIMEMFNTRGWHCTRAYSDRCLFIFESKAGRRVYMSVHTDDCQLIGDDEEDLKYIRDKFAEKYGIKDCNPEDMLGVKMELSKDGTEMELTQTAYIEQMYAKFGKYFKAKERQVELPMPDKTFI